VARSRAHLPRVPPTWTTSLRKSARRRRPGTAGRRQKHLLPVFGSTRLNEITIPAIKTFETKLKRAGYALSTVNGYVNVLLILLHAPSNFDLMDEFPLKKRLKRRKPDPLALELTDDERPRSATSRWRSKRSPRSRAGAVNRELQPSTRLHGPS
jgi:hypothetical protein